MCTSHVEHIREARFFFLSSKNENISSELGVYVLHEMSGDTRKNRHNNAGDLYPLLIRKKVVVFIHGYFAELEIRR